MIIRYLRLLLVKDIKSWVKRVCQTLHSTVRMNYLPRFDTGGTLAGFQNEKQSIETSENRLQGPLEELGGRVLGCVNVVDLVRVGLGSLV